MANSLKYLPLVAASAGLLLTATTLNHPAPQASGRPESVKVAALTTGPKADGPEKVAELLDSIIQPRFQKFGDGRFGVDRLVRTIGHDRVRFSAETPDEKKPLETALAKNHDFVIMFLHTTHLSATGVYRPGKGIVAAHEPGHLIRPIPGDIPEKGPPDLAARVLVYVDSRDYSPYHYKRRTSATDSDSNPFRDNSKSWQKSALEALPNLSKGQKIDKQTDNWLLAMRPVRVEQKACMGCHTQSKVGDTLGVMVYAVNREVVPSETTARK